MSCSRAAEPSPERRQIGRLTLFFIVSAASTAVIFLFIPLLRLGNKPSGLPAT